MRAAPREKSATYRGIGLTIGITGWTVRAQPRKIAASTVQNSRQLDRDHHFPDVAALCGLCHSLFDESPGAQRALRRCQRQDVNLHVPQMVSLLSYPSSIGAGRGRDPSSITGRYRGFAFGRSARMSRNFGCP
jgi:hypothetical protein